MLSSNNNVCYSFCNPIDTKGIGNDHTENLLFWGGDGSGSGIGSGSNDNGAFGGSRKIASGRVAEPDHMQSLAAELNALSVEERNQVYDEIHGVTEIAVEETQDVVSKSIQETKQCIQKIPKAKRKALDLAFFLRPSLVDDHAFFLMFLRAKQFNARLTAECMTAYFTEKKKLFGESFLVEKITLNHLTDLEIEFVKLGSIRFYANRESRGRWIHCNLLSLWNTLERKAFNRYTWYIFMTAIEENIDLQQKGIVSVNSFHGIHSVSVLMEIVSSCKSLLQSLPVHFNAVHLCYDDPAFNLVLQGVHSILPKDMRIRQRLHSGSILETQHVLMTFGIDLHDCFNLVYTNAFLHERLAFEQEWKRLQLNHSSFVDHPSQHDVIMGRSHISREWPGNVALARIIQNVADQYSKIHPSDRLAKMALTRQCILNLHKQFGTRFLERTDTGWQEVSDVVARTKVAQALRTTK